MRRALWCIYLGEMILKLNTIGCLQGETVTERHHTVHWEGHRGKMGRRQPKGVVSTLRVLCISYTTPHPLSKPSPAFKTEIQYHLLSDLQISNFPAVAYALNFRNASSEWSVLASRQWPCLIPLCVLQNIKQSTPTNDNCFYLFKQVCTEHFKHLIHLISQ